MALYCWEMLGWWKVLQSQSHLAGPLFSSRGPWLEVRLGHQQRHRFGWQASGGWRLRRARANLRALVHGVFGKLLDSRLQCRRELRSRGRLLAQVPHGPVGVCVKRVWRRWRGRESRWAGKSGVSRYAAVQELWQLQPFKDGFTDGKTLGVTLEDSWRLLWGSGSSVCVSQFLLTTLPVDGSTEGITQITKQLLRQFHLC